MAKRKRKKHGAHLVNSGMDRNGNWREYRCGPKRSAPVSFAKIFKGQKRDQVVSQIMDVLRGWRQSPFEHEAACRHGLRRALCLEGYGWARSDAEAAAIVGEGLLLLGAERPSWMEGQREYTLSRDYCATCHGPLGEEERTKGKRFCSVDCARIAFESRAYREAGHQHDLTKSAYLILRVDATPPGQCLHCKKPFKRINLHAESTRKSGRGKYCSLKCFHAHGRSEEYHGECTWCSRRYVAKSPKSLFCSGTCKTQMFRASKGKFPKRLSPPVFDYVMRHAAPNVIYLTPAVFDEVMREAA